MTKRIAIFIIVFVGLIVFFNSLLNGFVWDDEEQVLNNQLVHSIGNFPAFFMGSTFNTGGSGGLAGMYYKPMMSFFFSLLYTVFADRAFFFHLFQVGLHICNSILVFLLFSKIFSKKGLALFLSLIFLVHPLNVETAVYVSALQDTLFFFFGMLALLISSKTILSVKSIVVINLLLLCSFLSKETGFLFLPVILAYRYFILDNHKLLKLKYLAISFPVTIFVYYLLRFQVAKVYFHSFGPSPIMRASIFERLTTIPQIIFYYLRNFIFPNDLAIAQHWVIKTINFQDFYLPLLLILVIITIFATVCLKLLSKTKINIFVFFLFWFLIGLGLHLQIFPLDMTVADRWFYFPMVGLLGLLGILFSSFNLSKPNSGKVVVYLGIIVLIALSVKTMVRNSNWRDGLSIYSQDIKISKDAFDLENNLGVELFRNNRIEESAKHFERSTELAPYWWTNWNNLGVITERQGNLVKASEYYQKSIDNGNYYLGYENQAKLLYKLDPQKAKSFCYESLKTLPNNGQLWLILALAEYKTGNKQAALQAAQKAFVLSPTQQTYYLYTKLSQDQPLDLQM